MTGGKKRCVDVSSRKASLATLNTNAHADAALTNIAGAPIIVPKH